MALAACDAAARHRDRWPSVLSDDRFQEHEVRLIDPRVRGVAAGRDMTGQTSCHPSIVVQHCQQLPLQRRVSGQPVEPQFCRPSFDLPLSIRQIRGQIVRLPGDVGPNV